MTENYRPDSVNSEQLRDDIVRRVMQLTVLTPQRQRKWYMNSVESKRARYSHSESGFTVYSEARLCRDDGPSYKPIPVVEFWLPGEDLPDGTPTQRYYFVEQNGVMGGEHEKAVIVDGEWDDFEELEKWPDIENEHRGKVLKELMDINPTEL